MCTILFCIQIAVAWGSDVVIFEPKENDEATSTLKLVSERTLCPVTPFRVSPSDVAYLVSEPNHFAGLSCAVSVLGWRRFVRALITEQNRTIVLICSVEMVIS